MNVLARVSAAPGAAGPGSSDLAQAVLAIVPLQMIAGLLAEDLGCLDSEFLYHQDDTKVA